MYDVITVGSATVDVFAQTEFSELIKLQTPKWVENFLAYPVGTKILVKELDFTTGGGGTNTAVALARLGHKVAWLGKLGNDENADIIIKELKKDKVDILAVKGKGLSGYSVILDSLEHDRTILAYKGVNNDLNFYEINKKKLKTKWFYFSAMMNQSYKTLEKLAGFAKKNNIKIAFNASSYLAEKGVEFLKNILNKTDIFVLNKEEARLIAKHVKIEDLLVELHLLGPKIVVITDGKKGASTYDGSHFYYVKAHKINVVETTGAGDAFAATFLSGMIKKNDITFALKLAVTNAESVITHHGAKNKLLTYKEALNILRKWPVHVKKT